MGLDPAWLIVQLPVLSGSPPPVTVFQLCGPDSCHTILQTEEQRQAEEDRQERWQQLKENEANRQRQLVAPRTAMASPPPEVAVETRMVKRECWARTDGDMLVKKQCWVEEAAPTVCVQVRQ